MAERIIAALRQRGERVTIQRRMVIEALAAQADHLSVHDVQAALSAQGVDVSEPTVYRILQWLKDLGVIAQTDLGQRGVVYQLLDDPPHHHLVCLNCGHVIDIDDSVIASLRTRLAHEYGFQARIDHMAFFGLCPDCQAHADKGNT